MHPPIILASTSPRRRDLLSQAGLSFDVIAPGTDESAKRGELPAALVGRLAREKARSVADQARLRIPAALVIAADTIVVAPGGKRILGKPRDPREAERMLGSLQGKTHVVHTGYCCLRYSPSGRDQVINRVIASKVTMRKLSRRQIQVYVATGEPMDKAGSYAAQGMGMALIDRIQGSYSNVVGLPLAQVLADLEREFGISLFSWDSGKA